MRSALVIHPNHHWLAASPDDLVYDPTAADPLGIAEYKPPYKFRLDVLLNVATNAKDFCLKYEDDHPSLKQTHAYYYQIQTAMYCTKRKWCDFVIRTSTDLHIERIELDVGQHPPKSCYTCVPPARVCVC